MLVLNEWNIFTTLISRALLTTCSYEAKNITDPPGFCFCWAGVRATHGVSSGKVFEWLFSEFIVKWLIILSVLVLLVLVIIIIIYYHVVIIIIICYQLYLCSSTWMSFRDVFTTNSIQQQKKYYLFIPKKLSFPRCLLWKTLLNQTKVIYEYL